jgi:formyl-CoA transferase
MLLADMGADVIKIEEPSRGDDTRQYPPFLPDGFSAYFGNLNRNKRSIALDLKNGEGVAIFRGLAKSADVVVENYKPGTMKKLGISYDEMKPINPRLVFASISGFGQYGCYSDRPGYDIIGQAVGGLMSVSGWPDSPPTRSGMAMGDVLAGLNCCIGILAALQGRLVTGEGQSVDISLVDGVVSAMETIVEIYLVEGRIPGRIGNRYEFIAPYDSFEARDGWVVIACGNDAVWKRFCEAVERTDLMENPNFGSNASRVAHHAVLKQAVEAWTRVRDIEEIVEYLTACSIPCAPINTIDRVVNDQHIAIDREMFVDTETPSGAVMKAVASPIKLSDTKATLRLRPPELGEHSVEILRELLNLSDEQIARTRESGAFGKRNI